MTAPAADPPQMIEEVRSWCPDIVWAKLAGVERSLGSFHPNFTELCDGINSDCEDWEQWYNSAVPEADRPPGKLSGGSDLERMVLLRYACKQP